ncbi:hypothetical protein PIB30_005716 [Stylosanthes scabra]|uniref:Uncharacterized protein n=1 Tax=Stylosanthes scabra TaxID=79078 RepID=A0ABU6V325_9FABA|nr:hypothetical protein [Stylosanthes scabra]
MWDFKIHPPKGPQRPRWHIDPGSGSDSIWTIAEAPHTHSSKCVMLGRGIHTLTRHNSFSSPTNVGLHNPPPKGAQRPRWHIDPGSGSDTICNSPDHLLARYCPLWHTRPHDFAFDDRDDS